MRIYSCLTRKSLKHLISTKGIEMCFIFSYDFSKNFGARWEQLLVAFKGKTKNYVEQLGYINDSLALDVSWSRIFCSPFFLKSYIYFYFIIFN